MSMFQLPQFERRTTWGANFGVAKIGDWRDRRTDTALLQPSPLGYGRQAAQALEEFTELHGEVMRHNREEDPEN